MNTVASLPMTADLVARLREVIAFLLGEAPLDGRWYGDEPPRGEGHIAGYGAPYWWRKPLREAASALRSSGEAKPVAYIETVEHPPGSEFEAEVNLWLLPPGIKPPAGTQPLYLHPAITASAWRPIAEAQEGKLYVVGWLDGEDTKSPARHDFDYIEDGCWVGHEDCVQHADACAPPGSRLPPREPPYQWLIEVPEFPTPPTSTKA